MEIEKTLETIAKIVGANIDMNSLVASSLVADEDPLKGTGLDREEEVLTDDTPGEATTEETSEVGTEPIQEETPPETTETTEPLVEEKPVEQKVGPYDLIFQIRNITSAFKDVIDEAENLRKLTESVGAAADPENQAKWIEQRRFFIAKAKEAENKWREFKAALLKFSIKPTI